MPCGLLVAAIFWAPPGLFIIHDYRALAARLQEIVPNAVLVGGTAAAIHAGHRISLDHDHVLNDLRTHFADVLADLESVAGWKTARMARPVMILGSLDGIETGVRQLIREAPLETETLATLPTLLYQLRGLAIDTLAGSMYH